MIGLFGNKELIMSANKKDCMESSKKHMSDLDEACEMLLLTGDYDAPVSWQLIRDTIPCNPKFFTTRGFPYAKK